MIKIKDRIYGKFEITSPVILELINSPSLQRLKKIAQYGIPNKYYHLVGYSRYEHSVGVMLLLKKLGASEKEQIAGLLHDISHTAFSHVIDWIFDQGDRESFQDDHHEEYFYKTEAPSILKKYHLSPKEILDYHRYSLLEQPIPALCADRIDYAIREFPKNIAQICYKNFRVFNKKIVFRNQSRAYLFGHHYLKRQKNHWAGFEAASRYHIFSQTLKEGLKNKIISLDDFWKNDEYIIKKMEKIDNPQIKLILSILKNKSLKHLSKKNEKNYKKFRYIDPEILINKKLIKLSQINKKYAQELINAKKTNEKGVFQLYLN